VGRGEDGRLTYRVGRIRGLDALALEEESHRVQRLALAIAEGGHEFLQLRAALDLEEDLVVVVGDFDVEMLSRAASRGRLGLRRASVLRVVCHGVHLLRFDLRRGWKCWGFRP